jgi:hypothetical protein
MSNHTSHRTYLNLFAVKVFYCRVVFLYEAAGDELYGQSGLANTARAQNDDFEFTHLVADSDDTRGTNTLGRN